MTLEIKNSWNAINRVLTIINLILFMILNGQGFDYNKVKDKKVPLYLNVALLLALSFAVFVTFYGLLN
jgi:hypothetical protein